MLVAGRARAKRNGIEFTITVDDFEIPGRCPIFDIPLVSGAGTVHNGSPSLDRIVGSLGYVPGNVRCISHLANRRKSDMTIEQIERLLRYAKGELP